MPILDLPLAARLSEAVDFIVAFATSKAGQKMFRLLQDVHWIDAAGSRDVIATVNKKDFLAPDPDGEQLCMEFPYELTIPPKGMSPVEGSPGHFKATSVMHCESALLHYVLDRDIVVGPYIGASHPVCYTCLMLTRAINSTFKKRFAIGRRCGITIDPTWMLPEMSPELQNTLVSGLRKNLEPLYNRFSYDRARNRLIGVDVTAIRRMIGES